MQRVYERLTGKINTGAIEQHQNDTKAQQHKQTMMEMLQGNNFLNAIVLIVSHIYSVPWNKNPEPFENLEKSTIPAD